MLTYREKRKDWSNLSNFIVDLCCDDCLDIMEVNDTKVIKESNLEFENLSRPAFGFKNLDTLCHELRA
jgi:hypothetical protein